MADLDGVEVAAEGGETVSMLRRALARRLRAAGLEAADLEARLVVALALGIEPAAVIASPERRPTAAESAAIEALARRRLSGEPAARLAGVREFWSRPFRLTAETLVPRPDTETLVEAILSEVPAAARGTPLVLADLGTGSGAILVALLAELPAAIGVATDLSTGALMTARDNARDNGVGDRFHAVRASFGEVLADGAFDIIATNPPYIASADIAALPPEVREHDPLLALDGGADGLDAYRAVVPEAGRALRPGGLLALEVGAGQADAVAALLVRHGFPEPVSRRDLAAIPRVVMGRTSRAAAARGAGRQQSAIGEPGRPK